jgi:pilus assembly protein Flp/PilA
VLKDNVGSRLKEKKIMVNLFKELIADESGATAIEYGLIAALVSVAAIAALQALGGSLNTIFGTVSTTLDSSNTGIGTVGGGTP